MNDLKFFFNKRFFQKIGAAASAATYSSSSFKKDEKKNLISQGISCLANKFTSKPNTASDPDSMFLRYTVLTATCITVAFFIIKILK